MKTPCASLSISSSLSALGSTALTPSSRAGVDTLDHVMADRERACGADDAEQSRLLQIDAAMLGQETAEPAERRLHGARGLDQELGEIRPALRGVERAAPERIGHADVAVHATQVEEDVDIEQVPRIGAADPVTDALAPGRDRAAPFRRSSP